MNSSTISTLQHALGITMLVLAVAVGVQVILAAATDEWGYANDIWAITNWFIAGGTISAFEQSIRRALAADPSDQFERIASTFMLLLSATLLLVFFEQWFAVRLFAPDGYVLEPVRAMTWVATNVLFIAVSGSIGWRLVSGAGSRKM